MFSIALAEKITVSCGTMPMRVAQRMQIELADIDAVEQDAPGCGS